MVIYTILQSFFVGLLMLLAMALLIIATLFFTSFMAGIVGAITIHQWTNKQAKALFNRLVNTLKFKTRN